MKHFLVFKIKSVCYDSYTYFADSLAKKLQALGHQVTIFSAAEEPLENMERFVGMHFDAIFDFNSDLPKLKMDDDTYFLDQIHAPFYDVILDHPLYHHDMLKQKVKNFHVLCLDRFHKAYIEEYYPHISTVHVWGMTGDDVSPSNVVYPKKNIDILFSGTYTDYRQVEEALDLCPDFLGELSRTLITDMLADPTLPQEEALRRRLPDLDEVIAETFPLHMQACFLCDSYLRAWRREHILLELAKSGLPLTLCGNGWYNSPLADYPNVSIIEDTPFMDTFDLFRHSKITLNIMPGFCDGSHDRIYSAMLNHSLCITDATPMLMEQFSDEQELCYYDVQNTTALIEKIHYLLESPSMVQTLSEQGYQKAKENHTWNSRVAYLLSILFD